MKSLCLTLFLFCQTTFNNFDFTYSTKEEFIKGIANCTLLANTFIPPTERVIILISVGQAVLESDITDADLENCDGTRLEFWATKKALRQGNPVISLKAFLTKSLGMSGVSFGEMLEQSIGQSFSGIVKHEMVGRNKDILQASVSRILNNK